MNREEMSRMGRIHRHPRFKMCMSEIAEFERERVYCGHDLDHLIDTARIAHILNLEEDGTLPREWIYAAALLHDIGRGEEYKQNGAHDEVGAAIAATILADCGFTDEETAVITKAVRNHRKKAHLKEHDTDCPSGDERTELARLLSDYIRRADKLSRCCFECAAADTCYWPEAKRNLEITI